jgi:hypothetical protein
MSEIPSFETFLDFYGIEWSINLQRTVDKFNIPFYGVGSVDLVRIYCLYLCCFIGLSGCHRIVLGDYYCGIFYCVTCGMCCFGNAVDLCLIPGLMIFFDVFFIMEEL